MNDRITADTLNRYFAITQEALTKAGKALDETRLDYAHDFLDMSQRYFDDAGYFKNTKKDFVLAFAALNYAHGWLDAGARIGLFKVKDSRLFTVDS